MLDFSCRIKQNLTKRGVRMLDVSLDYCTPTTRLFLRNLYERSTRHVEVGRNILDLSSIPGGYITIASPIDIPLEQFIMELPKHLTGYLAEDSLFQLDTLILMHLHIIDRFFAEIVGYKNHIYAESDDEVVQAVQAYSLGDFSASDIAQELLQLANLGMIYRFFLAKKNFRLGFGKSQLRLCSWGRDYIEEDIFQHHNHATKHKQLYVCIQSSTYELLSPFQEEYRVFLDILTNEKPLDEEAFKIRERVPYKVVI